MKTYIGVIHKQVITASIVKGGTLLLSNGKSYLFGEYTVKDNKIIVKYNNVKYTLLYKSKKLSSFIIFLEDYLNEDRLFTKVKKQLNSSYDNYTFTLLIMLVILNHLDLNKLKYFIEDSISYKEDLKIPYQNTKEFIINYISTFSKTENDKNELLKLIQKL